MKALSKFNTNQGYKMILRVVVTVEATGDSQLSDQKIEEARMALWEWGLNDDITELNTD